MTFTTPSAVALLILVLAAYRLYRFIALDAFPPMIRLREWATGEDDEGKPIRREVVLDAEGTGKVTDYRPVRRPKWIADLWACSFCLGFWISLALVAAWWAWPTAALGFALPWAVSAGCALVTTRLDPS